MVHPWVAPSGILTLIFFLISFYYIAVASVREYGKRGTLYVAANAFLGPGFLVELISEVYENETAELLGHGLIVLAGLLYLLSFYLSKKELEKTGGALN